MCQDPILDKFGKLLPLWCLYLLISLPEGRSGAKLSQTDRNESFCLRHSKKGMFFLSWELLMGAFLAPRRKMEEKEKFGNISTLPFFLPLPVLSSSSF